MVIKVCFEEQKHFSVSFHIEDIIIHFVRYKDFFKFSLIDQNSYENLSFRREVGFM